AAGIAGNEEIVDDDHVADHGLADREVTADGAPEGLTGLGVEAEHLAVEGGEEDLALGVVEATGLGAAAALTGRFLDVHVRAELPEDDAVAVEVECVDVVRLRRGDVHGVADDERRSLVAVENADLPRPGDLELVDIVERDLVEGR